MAATTISHRQARQRSDHCLTMMSGGLTVLVATGLLVFILGGGWATWTSATIGAALLCWGSVCLAMAKRDLHGHRRGR